MQGTTSKNRISITIMQNMNLMLEKISQKEDISKSSLIETAIEKYLQYRLKQEGKELANLSFDDLPSEDDWISIQPQVK
jgi:metal-responsive CopG/Arc/MetJ family transcriptional regulator